MASRLQTTMNGEAPITSLVLNKTQTWLTWTPRGLLALPARPAEDNLLPSSLNQIQQIACTLLPTLNHISGHWLDDIVPTLAIPPVL
ncbi:hypothetical protein PtB15_12B483 [Puccinia triticina]|nr:hypothetical protein PtB15_12B483 [Puccinia triticina]